MEGLLPVSGYDGQMKWFITDSTNWYSMNIYHSHVNLRYCYKVQTSTWDLSKCRVQVLTLSYYSFPYLIVAGTITADNKYI